MWSERKYRSSRYSQALFKVIRLRLEKTHCIVSYWWMKKFLCNETLNVINLIKTYSKYIRWTYGSWIEKRYSRCLSIDTIGEREDVYRDVRYLSEICLGFFFGRVGELVNGWYLCFIEMIECINLMACFYIRTCLVVNECVENREMIVKLLSFVNLNLKVMVTYFAVLLNWTIEFLNVLIEITIFESKLWLFMVQIEV